MAHRQRTLAYLRRLPPITVATLSDIAVMVEERQLYGRGIGYVGAALLASAQLTPNTRLWTADRRLRLVAEDLGLAADTSRLKR